MDSIALDHPSGPSDDVDPGLTDFQPSSEPAFYSSAAASGGAKYKLMSPAKLPISRSPCLTIPPGLSPTSFLESPVLLSNMKAEPSPTTGSFLKPQMLYGSLSSTTYSATTVCSDFNTSDERNSGSFEFKPHAISNMVTTDYNHYRNEQPVQVPGQAQPQSHASPTLAKNEMAVSSNELSLSAPVHTGGASAPVEDDSGDLTQREHPHPGVQTSQGDNKGNGPSVISSDDGYNWRKYGQKHVKGSEFPRSYYKCTHPNCEVKKLFERSHDGQITEIIYKGTHDHPKPQPSRRYNTGAMMPAQEERSDKASSLTGQDDKPSSIYGQMSSNNEPNSTPELSPVTGNDDSVDGTGSLSNRLPDEVDEDDQFSKRRRMDVGSIDITPIVKPIREPRVVVQTLSEVDILDDGYRSLLRLLHLLKPHSNLSRSHRENHNKSIAPAPAPAAMETQSEGGGGQSMASIRTMAQQLEARIESQRTTQLELLSYLQSQIGPTIVPTIDLSLKVLSAFNDRPFTPTPPLPDPKPNPRKPIEPTLPSTPEPHRSRLPSPEPKPTNPIDQSPKLSLKPENSEPTPQAEPEKFSPIDEMGNPLSLVRAMVAVCLLEIVPFSRIDSSAVLRKLEGDQKATEEEKAALREMGGESGAILAVEMALRSMAEENGGVELEFVVGGKSRVVVLGIDRTRLMKELPESKQCHSRDLNSGVENGSLSQNQQQVVTSGSDGNGGGVFGMGGPSSRPMQDMWMNPNDAHMASFPPMFPGSGQPGSFMGPRGAPNPRVMGMMGMPRGMGGVPPMHRANSMGPNATMDSPNSMLHKPRSEEEELKDVEALLNKKTFRELQKSKTGEEILDLIHRPTAKETAVAAKFKTKGGSQLKEYCSSLTKEDCCRQSNSMHACEKVHFRRIIALHTDVNLGDCSFLDTCRHMKTCKYVHYELDPTPDVSHMMMGPPALAPPRQLRPQRAEYCSEVELGQPQWINCDIRNFRMDILGQFGVIMADPPWDIHMELPYGTMADDEMRNLNVPALQTDGLIFLWVTGRAMELGRECLEFWGYKRIEEIIWVKTNQLQRIIRTGRTGHWLNHSKEHCLVGIKGEPLVNRNIDTDVIVAEVRETSRKPDEMYPLLERVSPRTRKLELFARMHNTHAGWMSLGNQLSGVRLVDEGLRARFKAAYPDVEVQPASPPRPSAMEVDSTAAQMRSPFSETAAPEAPYAASEVKPSPMDVEMAG